MTTNEIGPGGCYPPTWPRPPIPPVPEPEPDSLDERVDWMTYSHPELYSMVHSGLDLTGAMAVSAKWARLGDELTEIGDALTKLINATTAAWQGEAADLARGSVAALADWSAQTGVSATEVSGCITIEVDNATNARNNMPAPPYPIMESGPATPKVPSSASAFTTGDFGTASTVVSDPMVWTRREQSSHQQAARTMETFQTNSREVYGTVPQFAPPDLRKMPLVDPGQPPEPQPQPQPPTPTTPQQTPPGSGGGAVVGSPGGSPGGSGGMVGSGGRPAATAEPLAGGGGGVGAAPGSPGASGQPAAAAAGRSGAPGGVGGMPMGGMGGGRGGEDTERKGPKYLDEDEDLWGGNDQRVMPPVIGEDRRRA